LIGGENLFHPHSLLSPSLNPSAVKSKAIGGGVEGLFLWRWHDDKLHHWSKNSVVKIEPTINSSDAHMSIFGWMINSQTPRSHPAALWLLGATALFSFQIFSKFFYYIESLDTYIEYKYKQKQKLITQFVCNLRDESFELS